ncbi:MAG: hypothetical protein JW882_09305 [Deltaproteobacteria bacterium]|nr:hypothetical protein [Deltaproteobacteria bacterium]
MVSVDTGVIAGEPLQHIVSGMGDAMWTYYDARTCFLNRQARTMAGERPTVMGFAISKLAAKLLFENGVEAVRQ